MKRRSTIFAPRSFAAWMTSFGVFVAEGHGYWDLSPTAEGTHITWTYVLTARSCEARPILSAAASAFFHPYMERGLASIVARVERGG